MGVRRSFRVIAMVGTAMAGVLVLAACADYTTTGYPAGEDGSAVLPSEPADALAGTSWQLSPTAPNVLDRYLITAAFADGRISGKAPVNTYSASYEVEGTHLTIGAIASTAMAGDASAMQAEGAYFAALSAVSSFDLTATQLELFGADEEHALLTFGPAATAEPDAQASEAATTQEFADTLVGKSEQDAQDATEKAGYTFRVIEREGEPLPATTDYRTDRINVVIEDGDVKSASVG